MNRFMQERWSWVEGTHSLRDELLNSLADADLAYTPGGRAMPLGELIREFGETEHTYVQSFKTRVQDWSYRHPHPEIALSLDQLKAWFQGLDADLHAALSAFSDDDFNQTVDRGGGFSLPISLHLDVYLQAVLIFLGKATIYLRVMDRPLPGNFRSWIG
jgi:hypothetical protein